MQVRLPINFTKLKTALTFNSNHMKKHLLIFTLAVLSCFAISCKKDNGTAGGGLDLTGMWALVDDRYMTDTYWDFRDGYVSVMKSGNSYGVANGTIWLSEASEFSLEKKSVFKQAKNVLFIDGKEIGELEYDKLYRSITVGEYKLLKVTQFDKEPYTCICCECGIDVDVAVTSATIICSLEKHIDGISYDRFIPGVGVAVDVDDDLKAKVTHSVNYSTIEFTLPVLPEEADHKCVLSYPGAESREITIHRTMGLPKIIFEKEQLETDYKAKTLSMGYSVELARPGMTLEAECGVLWINNLKVENGKVTFDVEKNEYGERDARVRVYAKDRDGNVRNNLDVFNVIQTAYQAPSVTVYPETVELDSKAQDLRINYRIDNPEDDAMLDIGVSKLDFMRIKEGAADYVIVSIESNDNTAAREGYVSFNYHRSGVTQPVYAVGYVTVKQSGITAAPAIKIDEHVIVTDYTAKEYEIPFTIENPVEGASLVMEAETVPWMTVVGITDKAVKLRFTEHSEYGVQRHVYAILKYVNKSKVTLASLDLNIHQTMDPPQITVEEGRTFNIGWQAEDITIHYSATNERTGGRFVIEPSASWLSVKSQSGNSAVIHAEGRTLGETQSRTGRFNIRYRVGDDDTHNFATLIETVVQEGAPAAPVVTIDEVPVTNYTKKKISLHIHVANDDPQHKGTVEITSVPDWFADDGTPAVWDAISETYVKTIEVAENPNVSGKVRTAGFVAKFRIPGIESEYLATGSISQTGDPVTITPKKYLMNDDVMGNYVLYDHLDHSDVKIEFTITNPRTGAYVDLYKGNPIGDSWIRGVSYGRDNVTFSLTKNTDDYKFRMSACTFAYTLDLNRLATYSLAIVQYNRYNGYDYIDLGLPSGKKWAPSCISLQSLNYVNQPDFAYGTPDKLYQPLSFQWASADGYYENYKYSTQVNGETVMTKYCNIPGHPYYDGLTKMLPSDDPAVRYLGGEWHTPSHADLNELFLYCTVSYESYSTMHYMKVVGPNGAVLMLRVDPLQYVSMDHSQMLRFMTSDGPIYEDCSKVYAVLYTYGAFDPNKEMEIWMHQVSNRSDAFVVLPVIDR